MIRFRVESRVLLLFACASFHIISATNKTLTSKEDDLSDIKVEENFGENTADKSKRHLGLPKVQSVVIDILKPVPVVDTIREEEKYGNTGDKFNKFGRAVVNGVEKMSNLVNSALNVILVENMSEYLTSIGADLRVGNMDYCPGWQMSKFPMEAVKKISRSATEALNNLGGKLVGLQR